MILLLSLVYAIYVKLLFPIKMHYAIISIMFMGGRKKKQLQVMPSDKLIVSQPQVLPLFLLLVE